MRHSKSFRNFAVVFDTVSDDACANNNNQQENNLLDMDHSLQISTFFTRNDRAFSLFAMTVGASFLTISAFDFDSREESKDRTIITTAFSSFLFACGMVLLLGTHRRLGLPVWNLFLVGNLCGGGALGLAVLILGAHQTFKVLASSSWGWIIGMGSYTLMKLDRDRSQEAALD